MKKTKSNFKTLFTNIAIKSSSLLRAIKPYVSAQDVLTDLAWPVLGLVNIAYGTLNMLGGLLGLFERSNTLFLSGVNRLASGVLNVLQTPFVWLAVPFRLISTACNTTHLRDDFDIQQLCERADALDIGQDEQSSQIREALHREYLKAQSNGQGADINAKEEDKRYKQAQAQAREPYEFLNPSLQRSLDKDYCRLFSLSQCDNSQSNAEPSYNNRVR